MKTKTWVLILVVSAAALGALGLFLLWPSSPAATAQIYSRGILIKTVDLRTDQEFRVASDQENYNLITVKNGKIAVTSASCPDHYCMHRGFCSSGAPIICLPNALEIRFLSSDGPDFSVG